MLRWNHLLLAATAAVLPLFAWADAPSAVWDYQSAAAMPESWNGITSAVAAQEKTPDGQAALEVTSQRDSGDLLWASFLNYVAPAAALENAKAVEVSFWARGEAGTELSLRVASERNTARPTASESFPLDGKWQKIVFRQNLLAPVGGKWACAPRLGISKTRAGQRLYLGPVSLAVIP